jgi:hypothetical protein
LLRPSCCWQVTVRGTGSLLFWKVEFSTFHFWLRRPTSMWVDGAIVALPALPARAYASTPAAHAGLSGSALAPSSAPAATAASPVAPLARTRQLPAAADVRSEEWLPFLPATALPARRCRSAGPLSLGPCLAVVPASRAVYVCALSIQSYTHVLLRSSHAPYHGCTSPTPRAATSIPYHAGAAASGSSAQRPLRPRATVVPSSSAAAAGPSHG